MGAENPRNDNVRQDNARPAVAGPDNAKGQCGSSRACPDSTVHGVLQSDAISAGGLSTAQSERS